MSSIHDTIRGLIAKAESSTHEGEVENCLRLVDKLLAKHNLTLADIAPEDLKVVIEKDVVQVHDSISWGRMLFTVVARHYGCKTVTSKVGYVFHMACAGRRGDVETAKLMYPFILGQLKKQAAAYAAEHGLTRDKSQRQIANALVMRIHSMTQAAARENNQPGEANALVPVDQIDAVIRDAFGITVKGRGRVGGYTGSARDAANKISVNRQAGNSGSVRMIGN